MTEGGVGRGKGGEGISGGEANVSSATITAEKKRLEGWEPSGRTIVRTS